MNVELSELWSKKIFIPISNMEKKGILTLVRMGMEFKKQPR